MTNIVYLLEFSSPAFRGFCKPDRERKSKEKRIIRIIRILKIVPERRKEERIEKTTPSFLSFSLAIFRKHVTLCDLSPSVSKGLFYPNFFLLIPEILVSFFPVSFSKTILLLSRFSSYFSLFELLTFFS